MAGHLRGYLVATSGRDRLRSATATRRPEPRERGRASLLINGASHVLTAAAITGALEHTVGNHAGGTAHARRVGLVNGAGQLDEAWEDPAELQGDGEKGADGGGRTIRVRGLRRKPRGEEPPAQRRLGALQGR